MQNSRACEHYTCDLLHHDLSAQEVAPASQPNQVASLSLAYTPDLLRTPLKEPIHNQYSQCFDFVATGIYGSHNLEIRVGISP